jgi:hypothetical protein
MKETGILRNRKIMKHDRKIDTVCHIIQLEWSLVNGHVQYAVCNYVADGIGERLTTDEFCAIYRGEGRHIRYYVYKNAISHFCPRYRTQRIHEYKFDHHPERNF